MPSCSILRIACAQEGKPEQFWSVVQGGGLKLGSESEAQCFVCHSELADRSCLIQHLQSGAFIEQGADRKLKLALSPASALPFSKLAAYSEGGNQVVKDSVWLRAASGGVVCSNAHDELIVAVNAAPCPARECCFTFETVDPNSFLMQGLACQSPEVHKEDSPLKLHHCPASVSIAAKPATHSLSNRSAAVPIALKRPIRKVSFNDLSLLHQSSSDQRSAPLHSALPRKSSSFSYSYSLKDAFSNRIPSSPACSHPSEGSDTDESKVRGGHHFDSDRLSSTDSLSILDQSLLGTPDSSAATSSPSDTLSSSLPSQQTSHDLISVNIADDLHHPVEQLQQGISANQLELGSNQLESSGRQGTHAGSPLAGSESPGRLDSYWTSWGSKTRGGNLFKKDGVRSTQSNSALSSIANGSHATAHRALNGHRTHGSQTALDFLSNSCSPRSPRRIPKTAEVPLDFAQSAPVMAEGLLANDGHRSLHGSTHDAHWPSFSSPQSPWDFSRKGLESLEAPSSLRLSRSSMDSHPREPMLPCIHEGVPSQDSEALERTAVETLLSRCGWRGDLNNGGESVQFCHCTDAQWSQSSLLPFPHQFQQPEGTFSSAKLACSPAKGTVDCQPQDRVVLPASAFSLCSDSDHSCFCSELQRYIKFKQLSPHLPFAGMKRVSSSPDMHNSINSPHPAIHKVTLRGSPSDEPSPFKRHHTHAASGDMCSHQLSPQMARLGLSVPV